jgi:LuxR family transcriptional regulator, maltose regulon positive regulatory protein
VVIVLDNYHVIDTSAIHDSLAAFVTYCRSRVHVVISSRTRPPLPFGRLRLGVDVTEIEAAELRLSDEEGRALLSRDPRIACNQQAIATVLGKTESWMAGVNLFAIALQHHDDLETLLAEFDGTHRYLTEYFFENVWRQQSPAIQTFLLHTAILENMCGSLCAAVTGLLGGQQMLASIEQANLFLIAVEQRPGWYHYHQLFSGSLRRMLEQTHPETCRPYIAERLPGIWSTAPSAMRSATCSLDNPSPRRPRCWTSTRCVCFNRAMSHACCADCRSCHMISCVSGLRSC